MKKKLKLIVLIIILLIIGFLIYSEIRNTNMNNTIIATKTEKINERDVKIKYSINLKNNKFVSITKELKFQTKEEAQNEYERYQVINEYEERNIGIELKKKKIILTMPVLQFLQDIEYDEETILIMAQNENYEIESVDLREIKDYLTAQGYTIK